MAINYVLCPHLEDPLVRTVLFILFLTIPAYAQAQPNAPQKVKLESGEFDPSLWDQALQTYVTYEGVDWKLWHASGAGTVGTFLKDASTFRLKSMMGKEPKVAFLMNAYNAFAVQQILDNYPVKSLEEIKGFFETNTVSIDGKDHTLNSLGDAIRAIGKHYPQCALSVSSGAVGYAPLAPRAYTSDNLLTLAVTVGRAFLKEQILWDGKDKTVTLPGVIGEHLPYFESQSQGLAGGLYPMIETSVLVILGSPHELNFHKTDLSLRATPPEIKQ